MVQRVTTNDNWWQRMTTSNKKWQWVTASDKTNEKKTWIQVFCCKYAKFKNVFLKNTTGGCFCVYKSGNWWHFQYNIFRSSHRRCSEERVFWEIPQNSQENACARASFLIKLQGSSCNFTKKEALEQMFSCEFCELSKNTFFAKHRQWLLLKI